MMTTNERADASETRLKPLPEDEVRELLERYEIPMPNYSIIETADELDALVLDYPVALKLCSSQILHKTEVGGVKLDIRTQPELLNALNKMMAKFPGERFIIESMEKPGVELIIGLIDDATFGLAIMFGLGGVFTEVLKDVTFRLVPIDEQDATAMLDDIRGREVLAGFRGMEVNRHKIVELLLQISKLGEELEGKIKSLDLNPVFARAKDIVVVDAKMVMKNADDQ